MKFVNTIFLVAFAALARADVSTIYVATAADGGSDTTGDGSYEAPYATISKAATAALSLSPRPTWAVISVRPGRYPGSIRVQVGTVLLDVRAQTRVDGVDVDNPDPSETIIDGALSNSHCVWFSGCQTLDGVATGHRISGFTLQNGIWTTYYQSGSESWNYSPVGGGGLVMHDAGIASNLVVRNCWVDTESRVPASSNPPQFANVCVNGSSLFVDSFVFNCTNRTHAGAKTAELHGAGVQVTGGSRMSRCVVSNCWSIGDKQYSGNHRGGGVYMQDANGMIDGCKILDCGYGGTYGGMGGGICTVVTTSIISNCLVSGCRTVGYDGGGISGDYGAWIEDTTVTNCYAGSGNGGGVAMTVYPTPRELGVLRRCHIVDCQRNSAGTAVRQNYGTAEECLVENNTAFYGTYAISGAHSVLKGSVIRNNWAKNGAAVSQVSYGEGTVTVSRCWIEGNTNQNGAVTRSGVWSRSFYVDNCYIRNNTGGCAVFAYCDSAQENTTDDMMTVQISNCTIISNNVGYSAAAVGFAGYYYPSGQYYVAGGPWNIGVTNCLVTGNRNNAKPSVPAFDGYIKANGSVGQIAYCAMATGETANLPDDPDGIAHNQAGRLGFMAGTLIPNGVSVAVDNAAMLEGMSAAKDLGDGSYTITKSADYGVHIVPNKSHRRIIGGKPDIGASEYRPAGFIIIHRH